MGSYSPQKLIGQVKQRIRDNYGQTVLNRALRDLNLAEDVLSYAERSDMDGTEDIADLYLGVFHGQLERLGKVPKQEPRAFKFTAPQRGSLQNVAAYAAVLPLVLQARQAVFGHSQPLSYEDAIEWLRKENDDAPLEVIELTFRFRVSTKDRVKLLGVAIGGNTKETLEQLQAAQIPVDLPMPESNLRESGYRAVFDEVSGEVFRMSSSKGAALAEWAEFIAVMCGGFDEAMWLLLTGRWERLGARGRFGAHPLNLSRMKEAQLDRRLKSRYAIPFTELHIRELETTPDEIKRYYSGIRKHYGYGSKGQAMSYRTEVLALIAVEMQEAEGLAIGDDGFYRHVLKRYLERAPMYGLEVNSNLNEEDVRKALKGVESAYSKMVSSHEAYEGYSPDLFKKS